MHGLPTLPSLPAHRAPHIGASPGSCIIVQTKAVPSPGHALEWSLVRVLVIRLPACARDCFLHTTQHGILITNWQKVIFSPTLFYLVFWRPLWGRGVASMKDKGRESKRFGRESLKPCRTSDKVLAILMGELVRLPVRGTLLWASKGQLQYPCHAQSPLSVGFPEGLGSWFKHCDKSQMCYRWRLATDS